MADLRLELPLEEGAPARARAEIRASAAEVDPAIVGDVLVIVTEAISNALHRRAERQPNEQVEVQLHLAPFEVSGQIRDGRLGFDVAVADFDTKVAPALYLIDHLSTRWGLEFGRGARLWFEVS